MIFATRRFGIDALEEEAEPGPPIEILLPFRERVRNDRFAWRDGLEWDDLPP